MKASALTAQTALTSEKPVANAASR